MGKINFKTIDGQQYNGTHQFVDTQLYGGFTDSINPLSNIGTAATDALNNNSSGNNVTNNESQHDENKAVQQAGTDTSVNRQSSKPGDETGGAAGEGDNPQNADENDLYTWDPRLHRIDKCLISGEKGTPHGVVIMPFASETIASLFFDNMYALPAGVLKELKKITGGDDNMELEDTTALVQNTDRNADDAKKELDEQIAEVEKAGKEIKADPIMEAQVRATPMPKQGKIMEEIGIGKESDYNTKESWFGTSSLINPYTLTRLCGGIEINNSTTKDYNNFMYDVRDTRRFYDSTGRSKLITDSNDMLSISDPTTTNIIRWSNRDKWGRTPYSFQDFVYCKWFGVIPNNHLITLRKYHAPTYDNLNFMGMDNTDEKGQTTSDGKNAGIFAPIATVITYFGEDTGNKLSDLINFTTGIPWAEAAADVWEVSGDTGSNPQAVIDSMFEGGGFGGVTSGSGIANTLLSFAGKQTANLLSFGKFAMGLNGKYHGMTQEAFEVASAGQMDPMSDQAYENKIWGPVNRISKTMKRADKTDIKFEQSFNIKCSYVARSIGGINPKAALLDILSNCMLIVSPQATWWGGAHRFNVHPHLYPFSDKGKRGQFMDKLYDGKIFGDDGALAFLVKGIHDFGTNGDGEFSWSTITGKLKDYFGQTVGALGSIISNVGSNIFGGAENFLSDIGKGISNLSTEEQRKAGEKKADNMFGTLNKMWKNQVIARSTMPQIRGLHAILTGEPVGDWHLTIGNPLNPIMVVGNLICEDMKVEWGDELGPDDFPTEFSVTYSLKHAMARDRDGIQSMFNRGAGRIYDLPDYIRASSDRETSVDGYTGIHAESSGIFKTPKFQTAGQLQKIARASGMTQVSGYHTYGPASEWNGTKKQLNEINGNPATTVVAKFTPYKRTEAIYDIGYRFLGDPGNYARIYSQQITRKYTK